MRCIFPLWQGHVVVTGSITRSHRGRCPDSFPMLRSAFLRGFFAAPVLSSASSPTGVGGASPLSLDEIARKLLCAYRREPFGARAEDQRIQRLDRRPQALVLRFNRERPFDQQGWIGWRRVRAKRRSGRNGCRRAVPHAQARSAADFGGKWLIQAKPQTAPRVIFNPPPFSHTG